MTSPETETPEGSARRWTVGEQVWAAVLLLVAVAAWRTAAGIDDRQAHDPLGPRSLPQAIAVLLGVASASLLARPVVLWVLARSTGRPPPRRPRTTGTGRGELRVLALAAIAVAYVVTLPVLTYLPATALAMVGVLAVLGTRGLRRLTIAPVLTAVTVHLVFTQLLGVRLP